MSTGLRQHHPSIRFIQPFVSNSPSGSLRDFAWAFICHSITPPKHTGRPPKGAPQYRKLFSSLISQTYCVPFHPFYSSCHLTCRLRRYLRHSAIHSSPSPRFIHCTAKAPYRPRVPSYPQLRAALPVSHIATHRLHIPFKPHNKSSCAICVYLSV